QAIEKTENLLRNDQCDWGDLVHVIKEIQMDQNKEWVKKYFTPEQQQQVEMLAAQFYSESALAKLAARGQQQPWTEADQERCSAQWEAVYAEVRRLTAAGADPAGAEAQALAQQHSALVGAFTGGDPEIMEGLKKFWQNHNALPEAQQPIQSPARHS